MRAILALLTALLVHPDDETYTVTLTFKTMHCDECKDSLLESLKRLPGAKEAKVEEAVATVTFEEKASFDYGKLKSACPRDLKLSAIEVARLRGVVSESGGKFTLSTKSSKQTLMLVNPEKPREDKLKALKEALKAGKNKFIVKGAAADAKTLIVESAEQTTWK